jgi:acetyltransferase-like isoleucine patch superfamily enzyme
MLQKITIFLINIYYRIYTFYQFGKGENNTFIIHRERKQSSAKWWNIPKGLRLKMSGRNNIVNLYLPVCFEKSSIMLECDEGKIDIGMNCRLLKADIFCGKGTSPVIKIGNGCTTEEVKIITRGSQQLIIEDDCMFATNILIRLTDSHYIYDTNSNEVINKQKRPATIGKHTWIGQNVCLTKNISIPANTIIGLGSIVGGSFTDEYTCIAGNPAKVTKRNVTWTRELEN